MSPLAAAIASWVLSAMDAVAPSTSFRHARRSVAEGLAVAAVESPLFVDDPGQPGSGAVKTAALEVAVVEGESGFRIAAAGDCPGLPPGSPLCTFEHANSVGLFQIAKDNAPKLGATVADLVGEPVVQARLAIRMMHQSFRICASMPDPEDRLGWYAKGGATCRRSTIAHYRFYRARTLLARLPIAYPLPEET